MSFFKNQRSFPTFTGKERADRWKKVVSKHHLIRKGMTAEDVVGILGLPDYDFSKGKNTWIRPEKGALQYGAGGTDPVFRVLHVYFDDEGKVVKVAKNDLFIFAPPPR